MLCVTEQSHIAGSNTYNNRVDFQSQHKYVFGINFIINKNILCSISSRKFKCMHEKPNKVIIIIPFTLFYRTQKDEKPALAIIFFSAGKHRQTIMNSRNDIKRPIIFNDILQSWNKYVCDVSCILLLQIYIDLIT